MPRFGLTASCCCRGEDESRGGLVAARASARYVAQAHRIGKIRGLTAATGPDLQANPFRLLCCNSGGRACRLGRKALKVESMALQRAIHLPPVLFGRFGRQQFSRAKNRPTVGAIGAAQVGTAMRHD